MDELASQPPAGGGGAQRVGARVRRVIGAAHELLPLERANHLGGGHRVDARVARQHDLRHRLVTLGE
jgi:hypothetical protein